MIQILWNILLATFMIALILITAVGTVLLLYTIIELMAEMIKEKIEERNNKHGENGSCN